MNSSERWASYFIEALECTRCRTRQNLNLYSYDKKLIQVDQHSIEQLKLMIPRMDVWCPKCAVTFTTRVTGPGRLKHKYEAAQIADIKLIGQSSSFYDTHVLEDTLSTLTKQDVINLGKEQPCVVCGRSFHVCAMDYHHVNAKTKVANVSAMISPLYTMRELIEEIEKCAVVCAVCHRLITNGIIDSPTQTVNLHENIFTFKK